METHKENKPLFAFGKSVGKVFSIETHKENEPLFGFGKSYGKIFIVKSKTLMV
jgi:hypothetical protein